MAKTFTVAINGEKHEIRPRGVLFHSKLRREGVVLAGLANSGEGLNEVTFTRVKSSIRPLPEGGLVGRNGRRNIRVRVGPEKR